MTTGPDSKSAPRSVGDLMSEGGAGFGRILKRARALEKLNTRVMGLLGEDLADRCQVANVRDKRIIFACTSSGIATRLRMQSAEILDRLHAAGLEDIEGIEVRMTPPPEAG